MQSNCTINYSFMEGSERELLIAPMTSQPWWSNMMSSSLICSACFFGCVCVAVVVVGCVCGACGNDCHQSRAIFGRRLRPPHLSFTGWSE